MGTEGTPGGNGQAPTADSANGQAPTQGTPTAGNGQAPASHSNDPSQSQSQQGSQAQGQQAYTPPDEAAWKRIQQELAEARREAATYRKAKEEADTAKLTEEQKREKRLADLERAHADLQRTHQDRVLQYEVRLSAAAANFRDPADALSLIDLAAVKFDDEGRPENIGALIEAVAKAKPYLLRDAAGAGAPSGGSQAPNPTAGGATNPSRSSTNGGAKPALSYEFIDQLIATNPQEYVARGEEIRRWLMEHPRRGRY